MATAHTSGVSRRILLPLLTYNPPSPSCLSPPRRSPSLLCGLPNFASEFVSHVIGMTTSKLTPSGKQVPSFHVFHRSSRSSKYLSHPGCPLRNSGPSLRPFLGSQILDSCLDRILGKHRAMKLHRRELEVSGNVRILDGHALLHCFSLQPLGRHRAARYGRTTSKGLEFALSDFPIFVYPDLKFHDIAAGWRTHKALWRHVSRCYYTRILKTSSAHSPTVPTFGSVLSSEPTLRGFS